MARRSISLLGSVIRNLTSSCSENYAATSYRHCVNLRHACLSTTAKRFCVATQLKTDLEDVLDKRDVDSLFQIMDTTRDVYTRGFQRATSKEHIQNFFEDSEVEEVHTLHSEKTNTKVFHYVRFKDLVSKQNGMDKHKENFHSKYVEVFDMHDFEKLGLFMLADRSTMVFLKNLPFEVKSEDVISWLKERSINVNSIQFLSRGSCIVDLKSTELVAQAAQHSSEQLGGRSVFIKAFLQQKDIADFREKCKSFRSGA